MVKAVCEVQVPGGWLHEWALGRENHAQIHTKNPLPSS